MGSMCMHIAGSTHIKIKICGAVDGSVVKSTDTALAENLDSIPSTHMEAG